MADIKDVTTVLVSALEEVNLSGKLGVRMDGAESAQPLMEARGDDVEVVVIVKRVGETA